MLRFSDVPCHRGFPYARALWLVAVAGILAVVGTSLTPYAVERMSDHGFRRSVQAIIVAISISRARCGAGSAESRY